MSARAAARLESLGFRQVYRYTAGKVDWLANGWPSEGKKTEQKQACDLAVREVPTCQLAETIGAVRSRVRADGWDTCVVVDDRRVVLGLLRKGALDSNPDSKAESAMESGPRTYRLDANLQKTVDYMRRFDQDSVLVTCSDGTLNGLLKREDAERFAGSSPEGTGS